MKRPKNQIQQMIDAMEPTQKYVDLLDATSVAKQFERAMQASDMDVLNQDASMIAARIKKDRSIFSATDTINAIVKASKENSALHGDLMKSLGSDIGSILRDGRQFEDLQKSQFQDFSQMVSGFLPEFSGAVEIFRPLSQFAEFEVVGGMFVDLAASFNVEVGFDVDSDADGGRTENEEGEPALLESLRTGIIDVRGLPIRFIEFLKQEPLEVLQSLTWRQLEELVAEICEKKLGGEDVYLTRNSSKGDHGLDVVGSFQVDGIKTVFGFQCKKYSPHNKIEGHHVRELRGALSFSPHKASRGIICTTSDFRKQATEYFVQNVEVSGWGPDDIVERAINDSGTI